MNAWRDNLRYWLLSGALGVACVALALGLYRQLTVDPVPGTSDLPPIAGTADAGDAAAPLQSLQTALDVDIGSYDELIERPLFVRSRRRPEAADPDASEAPPTLAPTVVLRGVVHSSGARRVLLEQADPTQPLLRLQEGESLDGWEIIRIQPRTMVLRLGEQSLEVRMLPPGSALP